MKFELNFKRNNIPDEELLQDIRDVAMKLNLDKVSKLIYEKHGKFDCRTIERRFGTWNEAIRLAGLEATQLEQYTEQELFENILNVWMAKGKQPTRREMNEKSLSSISSGAYQRRFKSWVIALESFIKYMEESNASDEISVNLSVDFNLSNKKPRDPSLRLRYKVLKRDNYSCKLCGNSPAKNPNVVLHIDHILPWSKGGETIIENLQTLCQDCNLGKSDLL